MLALLAAGSLCFPGLFLLSKRSLKHTLRWSEGDAAIVSARLVSSIQAVMASSAGYIIASSCNDVMEDQHWLTNTYILFATPYFAYDIYAMFLCYWHKLQVKGHEEADAKSTMGSAVPGYLRHEFLMVLHHIVMVTVCFPASVFWRQGKGDYFQGVLFLAELSTPSVCLGKVLIQYKKQQTVLHRVNGAVMLITFCCCRVLLFPYLYYAYSRYASIPMYRVPLVAPWQCNALAALLMAPQLYWFPMYRVPLVAPWQCNALAALLMAPQLYWFPMYRVPLVAPWQCNALAALLMAPQLYWFPMYRVPLVAPWQCNALAALLMAPQLYWFGLICRGAFRLFRGAPRSPPSLKADSDGPPPPANGYSPRQADRETDAR